MRNCALNLEEHPWQSRSLPRRPTRLVAVPSAAPRAHRGPEATLWLRGCRHVAGVVAESVAFLLVLVGAMGGVWALSLF